MSFFIHLSSGQPGASSHPRRYGTAVCYSSIPCPPSSSSSTEWNSNRIHCSTHSGLHRSDASPRSQSEHLRIQSDPWGTEWHNCQCAACIWNRHSKLKSRLQSSPYTVINCKKSSILYIVIILISLYYSHSKNQIYGMLVLQMDSHDIYVYNL